MGGNMSNRTTKTRSAHLDKKVQVRLQAIKGLKNINVLDCYHAHGEIWEVISTKIKINNVTGIDIIDSNTKFNFIKGDNEQVVKELNIDEYNVIDLDAFSDCTNLLLYLVPIAKVGTVFIYTQNLNHVSGPPINLKGREKAINKKAKGITNKFVNDKWLGFLHQLGVKKINEISFKEGWFLKKYGYFIKEVNNE